MSKFYYFIIICFLILCSIPSTSYAQQHIGINFGYGIPFYKINIATNETYIAYTPNDAFIAEINYKKRWPGFFSIGGDLNFNNRNIKLDMKQNSFDNIIVSSNDFYLYYTNIDVFAEFKFGRKTKFYLQIGPALSFMIFSQMEGYTEITNNNGSSQKIKTFNDGNATDYFSIFNNYFYSAAGIDIPMNSNWYISGKFQFQYETGSDNYGQYNSISNRGLYFQLGATYILPSLGKSN